jgi:hypothetical protein
MFYISVNPTWTTVVLNSSSWYEPLSSLNRSVPYALQRRLTIRTKVCQLLHLTEYVSEVRAKIVSIKRSQSFIVSMLIINNYTYHTSPLRHIKSHA